MTKAEVETWMQECKNVPDIDTRNRLLRTLAALQRAYEVTLDDDPKPSIHSVAFGFNEGVREVWAAIQNEEEM